MTSSAHDSGVPTEGSQDEPVEPGEATAHDQAARDHELLNAAYADEIMVGDDAALHAEYKEFLARHGVSAENIERLFETRRLRDAVHKEMRQERERRLAADPAPTDDELSIGVYLEDLEPQVRNAVVTLVKKGYSTRGSGFDAHISQSINLDPGRTDFASVPQEIRAKLESMGVVFDKKGSIISFECEADVEKMKAKWDEIAALLPDLGTPTIDHDPAYLTFAKNAKKYRGKSYPRYEKYYDKE